MRRRSLAIFVAPLSLLAVLAVAPAASADVVVLTNGDLLYGRLDGTALTVETRDGVVQVSTGDLREVRLHLQSGDVLLFRNGTVLTGSLVQPNYAVRLASGQTVTIERSQLSFIGFPGRLR
jgi:DUF4097 and DUF4098 domain-containing protein YvlB